MVARATPLIRYGCIGDLSAIRPTADAGVGADSIPDGGVDSWISRHTGGSQRIGRTITGWNPGKFNRIEAGVGLGRGWSGSKTTNTINAVAPLVCAESRRTRLTGDC